MKKQILFFSMFMIAFLQLMTFSVSAQSLSDVQGHRDACDITTLPYTQNFDVNTTAGQRPPCWSGLNNMGNNFPQVFAGQHYSGSYSLYFNGTIPSPYCIIVSPTIDSTISLSSLQVTFMLRIATTNPCFVVGVMTDISDATSFVPIDTVVAGTTNTWESHTVNFLGYSGTGKHIAFQLNYGALTCLDDVSIDYAPVPSCMPVSNFMADSLYCNSATTGTAVFSWNSNNSGNNSYIFKYKNSNQSTWNTINVSNVTSYSLTGLSVNTDYEARIAVQCDTTTSIYRSISFSIGYVAPCLVPLNLNVSNVSSSSAVISWTAGGSESSWILEYKSNAETAYNTVSCPSTSYTLSDLLPSTNYTIRLKAVCDTNNFSAYTAEQNFTTAAQSVNYMITSSCGVNGNITPLGVQTVAEHTNLTFTITPNTNYVIHQLLVDGTEVTATNNYTFSDITDNHTLYAEFSPNSVEDFDLSKEVLLYPNPCGKYVNLNVLNNDINIISVKILDVMGRNITDCAPTIAGQTIHINVQNLQSGFYFVCLYTNKGSAIKKIVKQ